MRLLIFFHWFLLDFEPVFDDVLSFLLDVRAFVSDFYWCLLVFKPLLAIFQFISIGFFGRCSMI